MHTAGIVSMYVGDGSTARLTGIHTEMYGASAILVDDIDDIGGGQVGPEPSQVLTKFW